ncbi:MAG: hypothetical protein A2087_07655 [Spirochaetes bacterium GWD1_61_31]|nr:MAG: hypothetical protein A2Y37_07815 [Spirochaetes bacterium GWB1_60_80]OHD34280.1 MAG: hypothetical protein A2004_12935 [Spirochaetes bacterium GWC1_61_12]OHD40208.1 MAG: hypothetical protein A2087_07655 [Spirochaetes bacterium GWD1_61_31]OHD45744.1 MAG: hypothetical protein A2Y35_03450 [Spirochaetes bacterium GWE1_60_18]OHD58289.1 MAG: hypothetical protein A2Y32_05840 [Spirochaetes bacterium GWF1_60_12]HAX37329.1 peptidase M20 [Spirochaetaceae bacterium]
MLYILGFAMLVTLVLFILIRTLLFRPYPTGNFHTSIPTVTSERLQNTFPQLLRCRTISHDNTSLIDFQEFEAFKQLLATLYPKVFTTCQHEEIGPTGLLFLWPGKEPGPSTILMAHYDVVPVEEEFWTKPAFAGLFEDNTFWGRGSLDTKGTLCAILEAAECLAASGFQPKHDLYFSFSGDEEVSGPSTPAIVQILKARGVKPELVLDEGGAIVENIFPGIKQSVAVVGSGEKGYLDLIIDLSGPGGHSSTPPQHSLVGRLAKAIVNIENKPFQTCFTKPVMAMLNNLGRYAGLGLRLVFANLWLFKPLLASIFHKNGCELDAMIRTTIAVTTLSGSQAFNVMPPKASAGINLRLLDVNTVKEAVEHIKKSAATPGLTCTIVESHEASPPANLSSPAWHCVRRIITATWPEVIISPYLMLAATDSRHYCEICDCVLRFSAMRLSKAERDMIHGHDERIKLENLLGTVGFFLRLMMSR